MINVEKGQLARLYDIFILGPILIWVGYNSKINVEKVKSNIIKTFIITSGITTITYNGYNFIGNLLTKKKMITNDYIHAILFLILYIIIYSTIN